MEEEEFEKVFTKGIRHQLIVKYTDKPDVLCLSVFIFASDYIIPISRPGYVYLFSDGWKIAAVPLQYIKEIF